MGASNHGRERATRAYSGTPHGASSGVPRLQGCLGRCRCRLAPVALSRGPRTEVLVIAGAATGWRSGRRQCAVGEPQGGALEDVGLTAAHFGEAERAARLAGDQGAGEDHVFAPGLNTR